MNVWIIKNIRFGYKYSSNGLMRKQINTCLYDWLDDLLSKKSRIGDAIIIVGGLFSNTNPSIIAIDDAHKFIKKLSSKLNVYLVNTEGDARLFDNEMYSTLDIFSDIENVTVIKDYMIDVDVMTIIPHGKSDFLDRIIRLDVNSNKLGDITIPNIMQLERTDGKPGLIVFNTQSEKQIFIENKLSPKHVTFLINDLSDFDLIDKDKHKDNFIHIEINNNLVTDKKLEVNILLHNVNASSVKYVDGIQRDDLTNDNHHITTSLNIKDVIYDHIGDNDEIKNQFNRVLKVYEK